MTTSRRIRPRAVALTTGLLLVLGLGLSLFLFHESRRGILREAEVRAEGNAMLVAERLQAMLSSVDLMLNAAGEGCLHDKDGLKAGRPASLVFTPELTGLYLTKGPQVTALARFPALARLEAVLPALARELADSRVRFDLRALPGEDAGLLLVSRLFQDVDGKPCLLTATLQEQDVVRQLRRLDVPDLSCVLIMDHQGRPLLHSSLVSAEDHEALPAGFKPLSGLRTAILERTVAASYPLAFFPLKAAVTMDQKALLTPWRQDVFRRSLFVGSGALLLLLLGAYAWRSELRLQRSDATARLNEAKYRSLFDNAPDAMFLFEAEGRFLDANAAALKRLGCSLAEIRERAAGDFGSARFRAAQAEARRVLAREGRVIFETEHVAMDGRTAPVESHVALFAAEGKRYGVCIARDLSERNRLQAELRQAHETLRAIFNAIPGLINVVDRQYLVIDQSENFKRHARRLEEAARTGRLCFEKTRGRDSICPDCCVEAVFATGQASGRMTTPAEQAQIGFPAMIQAAPVVNDQGEVWAAVELIMDVSEIEAARNALKTSQERFDLVIRSAGLGIWDWDVASGQVVFNERWAGMLGYALSEIEPWVASWERLLHPEDKERALQALQDHLEGRTERYESEHRLRDKGGDWVWILDAGQVVSRGPSGAPARVTGVHLDITRRKQAELALQRSEQRYKALLEDQAELVVRCDADLKILVCNASFSRAMGLDRSDPTDGALPAVLVRADALPALEALTALTPEQSHARVSTRLRNVGEARWIEWSCRAFFAEDGLEGYQLVGHDVTDRMERERLKEDVELIIRHDLRGPISTALYVPELLRNQGPLTEEQLRILGHLETTTRRALRLLNLSLDLYKMEMGQFLLTKTTFDVTPLLDMIRMELTPLLQAKEAAIEVLQDNGAAGDSFAVHGDASLVHTLLENLVRNAVEASPNQAVVRITLGRTEERASIAIANRNAIPLELRERLFEKYATAGKSKGTGLGVYSARLMARAHGGDVTFETDDRTGTTFFVRLPEEAASRSAA